MPIVLSDEEKYLDIRDTQSNQIVRLFHRQPTTREIADYTNNQFVRKGRKMVSQVGELRFKYGAEICTGIRDGDFVRPDGKGGFVPMSSSKDSPDYYPDWKGLLKKHAPEMLNLLAAHIFEGSVEADEDLLEPEPGSGADPAEDLEKN